MLSPNSKELDIVNLMREIPDLSTRSFVGIAQRMGIKTNPTTFADAISPKTRETLDPRTAVRIIELLNDLNQIKSLFQLPSDLAQVQTQLGLPVPVAPIDYTQHEVICDCLLILRLRRILNEESQA